MVERSDAAAGGCCPGPLDVDTVAGCCPTLGRCNLAISIAAIAAFACCAEREVFGMGWGGEGRRGDAGEGGAGREVAEEGEGAGGKGGGSSLAGGRQLALAWLSPLGGGSTGVLGVRPRVAEGKRLVGSLTAAPPCGGGGGAARLERSERLERSGVEGLGPRGGPVPPSP